MRILRFPAGPSVIEALGDCKVIVNCRVWSVPESKQGQDLAGARLPHELPDRRNLGGKLAHPPSARNTMSSKLTCAVGQDPAPA